MLELASALMVGWDAEGAGARTRADGPMMDGWMDVSTWR